MIVLKALWFIVKMIYEVLDFALKTLGVILDAFSGDDGQSSDQPEKGREEITSAIQQGDSVAVYGGNDGNDRCLWSKTGILVGYGSHSVSIRSLSDTGATAGSVKVYDERGSLIRSAQTY